MGFTRETGRKERNKATSREKEKKMLGSGAELGGYPIWLSFRTTQHWSRGKGEGKKKPKGRERRKERRKKLKKEKKMFLPPSFATLTFYLQPPPHSSC